MRRPKNSKDSIIGGWESNKENSLEVEEEAFELHTEKIIRETVTYGN